MNATFLALALGCSGSSPSPESAADAPGAPARQTVVLALNWFPEPEFGGFYEGLLGGIYEQAGFDVHIMPGGPGAPTLELLQSGKVDAAITAADDLLVKRSKGVKAVAAWAGFQDTPIGLMAHSSAGLESLADLGEHPELRVAIEIGGPFQQWLWQQQGFEGKVQTVPTTGSVAAFLADEDLVQQAYITSEPCVARGKGAQVDFLPAKGSGWNPYGTVLAFSDPLPEWAPRFVAATQRAWEAYRAAPTRANAEIARLNDQLQGELLDCITQAQEPFLTGTDGLGAMTAQRWQQTHDALVTIGLLSADTSPEGAWIRVPSP